MSEYGAITPTTNGLTMITESVVKKKPIVFTKIAIGDGALTNQNIEALTALIRQKQEAPIHIVTDKGAGLADVSAVITNAGLSTGYYARELGVFAKVGDTGQEKLFAYTNAGANASYSPADGSLDEKLITVTFKIGTGATLKVALNSQVYLTLGNLEEHNTSSSAHADIRQLFKNYLPLTGGTVTGRLYVNDAVFMGTETSQYGNFIERSKAGTMYLASGKSENSNTSWFNVDGYFKYPNTAEMCVIKRDENSNILARAFLLDQDNKTRFPNEVYANEKLLATKEYVDLKKWGSTSITDGAVTPTKLDRPYLPLTGGTVTGRLHVNDLVSTGSDTMQFSNFIQTSLAGKAYLTTGKNNSDNWFNVDGYFNNPEQSNIGVLKRNADGTVIARAYLLHNDNKTYFPNEVYSNQKLLATKEYVDTKSTNDINAHNTSSSAHNDIRTKITNDINTHNSSNSAHTDIRQMFNNYLPLTGGTVTGRLHVNDLVSTGNDTMQFSNFIQTSMAGKAYFATGKSASESWFNLDAYFNNPEQSNISALKRNTNGEVIARAYLLDKDNKTRFPDEVYSNGKLLATKEYVDTKGTNDINAHNTSGGAHADIRQMFNNYWSRAEADNRFLLSNHLSVTSGTVANGAGIPIPNGYVLNQCRFLVSFSDDNPSHYWYDINEGGVNQMDQRICRVKPGTNIVECYWVAQGYDSWYKSDRNTRLVLSGENELIDGKRYYKMPAIANYICIAVK